jgi:hypothetical protein
VIPAEQTPPMAGNAGGATAHPRGRC